MEILNKLRRLFRKEKQESNVLSEQGLRAVSSGNGPLIFGSVPIPEDSHILIVGQDGTGKTTILDQHIKELQRLGKEVVVIDFILLKGPSDKWIINDEADAENVIQELLSRPDGSQQIYVLFESTGIAIPSLPALLKAGRSKGIVVEMAITDISVVQNAYGKDEARRIIDSFSIKLVMNTGDPETAEYFSKVFGEEKNVTPSNSLRPKTKSVRRLILPVEIMRLPVGEGYLQLEDGNCGRLKTKTHLRIHEEEREYGYAVELGLVNLPGGTASLEDLDALVSAWRAIYTGRRTEAKYSKFREELSTFRERIKARSSMAELVSQSGGMSVSFFLPEKLQRKKILTDPKGEWIEKHGNIV